MSNHNYHVAVSGVGGGGIVGHKAAVDAIQNQFINGEMPSDDKPDVTIANCSNSGYVAADRNPEPKDDAGDVVFPEEPQTGAIDFSGKDFAETQKLLNANARLNTLNKELSNVQNQKKGIVEQSFKKTASEEEMDPGDVIQYHLDKFASHESLYKHLSGKVTDKQVADRINAFFVNPDTGEELELSSGPKVKNPSEELEFKRGMLLYFKQNDELIEKIDKEVQGLNEATAELESNISAALNPLKDSVYTYAVYLEEQSEPLEEDDEETLRKKRAEHKKATAILNAYNLRNMIDLVQSRPSIIDNSLKDFRSESRLKDIGERYASKLRTSGIDFNLFALLSDDPHDSLEYRVLPQGDYPAGLEGFTVFFIIRSLSMTLPNDEDAVFHASVQVAYKQLMENKMDEDIAVIIKDSIKEFLSYFSK